MTSLPIPRPEHPRPDWQRPEWFSLNGPWRFSFDPDNRGEHERWHRIRHPLIGTPDQGVADPFTQTITVPFPWESRASGIADTTYVGVAWYQRTLHAPRAWASPTGGWALRPWLVFGAVDWGTRVWIDGRFAGEHVGGYTPFALDLGDFLTPEKAHTVTLRVYDHNDADTPVGKQTRRWYTNSSGIWQSVMMEGRPETYLDRVEIETPLDPTPHAVVRVAIHGSTTATGSPASITVTSRDGAFLPATTTVNIEAGETWASIAVWPEDPKLWSPDSPTLYDCTITATTSHELGPDNGAFGDVRIDTVQTYFGIREIARGPWPDRDHEVILLNRTPLYLRGALDQAFHPETLHAYPSDDVIRRDVEMARELGLNMLRCHIKVNDPRYYYWADVLGVVIMYDLPCTMVDTPTARRNWELTFRGAIARDRSHPSIIAWVLFNETWGLDDFNSRPSWEWVASMFHACKALDPTRLVEDNSPCLYDHVVSDINSWHFYITNWDRARSHVARVIAETFPGSPFNYVAGKYGSDASGYAQSTAPLMNSEYAGLSARQGEKDIAHSFRFLTTDLRRHEKCVGYVYTELTDIEWEHNGLINYDRTPKLFGYDTFFPEMTPADINGADVVGFDAPPFQVVTPGDTLHLDAFVSHWSNQPLAQPELRWAMDVIDIDGHRHLDVTSGSRTLILRRYGVTDGLQITLPCPNEPMMRGSLATVRVWLLDGSNQVRARNYTQFQIGDPPETTEPDFGRAHAPVAHTATNVIWRPRPGAYTRSSWQELRIAPGGQKFGAVGSGFVEYDLALPAGISRTEISAITLRFEAGARTALQRRGWHDTRYFQATDYPQTRPIGRGTTIEVLIDGVSITTVHPENDYADARGIFSLTTAPEWDFASAGTMYTLEASADATAAIRELADDHAILSLRFSVPRGSNGINLYGVGRGGTPVTPTISISCHKR